MRWPQNSTFGLDHANTDRYVATMGYGPSCIMRNFLDSADGQIAHLGVKCVSDLGERFQN